jgi:ribosomal protein L31E
VLKGKIEPYTFEIGILKDVPHRNPLGKKVFRARTKAKLKKNLSGKSKTTKLRPMLGKLAGGPVRRAGKVGTQTVAQVSQSVRQQTGINYLRQPFKKKSDDAVKMLRTFWKLVFKEGKLKTKKRLENLLQAIVRNPLVRRTYGKNSKATIRTKGFDRKFIDTGQLFKNINAKVRIKIVRKAS